MLMNTRNLKLTLAVVSMGWLFVAAGAQAQDYRSGSLEARTVGYEHGYRDGYQYGLDRRAQNASLDLKAEDADRGYRSYYGPKDEYKEGYREGYRAGATDGFGGVQTRFAEIYGYRDPRYDPDVITQPDRTTTVYIERHWAGEDVATDIGYRDGVNAGLKDFREHHSFRPEDHSAWKDADRGYDKAFGSKDEYKRAYRAGYEMGYRQGFGLRR